MAAGTLVSSKNKSIWPSHLQIAI